MSTSTNARELLIKLGIGQFNATMVIQYMFIAPATTDPKSPPIMLLVRSIQQKLQALGYAVPLNGYLGEETAQALDHAVGAAWERLTWSDVVQGVLQAAPVRVEARLASPKASMGIIPSLPSVPGGMLTYAAGAAAAYYFLIHKKRR